MFQYFDFDFTEDKKCIPDSELLLLSEKTNRHMRLRELLLQYSQESTFVVMYVFMHQYFVKNMCV